MHSVSLLNTQIVVALLSFLLQSVSHDTPSSKASLSVPGLSMSMVGMRYSYMLRISAHYEHCSSAIRLLQQLTCSSVTVFYLLSSLMYHLQFWLIDRSHSTSLRHEAWPLIDSYNKDGDHSCMDLPHSMAIAMGATACNKDKR